MSADFNNDGWMDIYVANDGKENLLWMNQRNGTFKNMGLLSGAALSGDGKPEASMGVDAGDFDNDGDEDLFMTHLPAEGNNLYVNDGTALFEDVSAPSRTRPVEPRATPVSAPPGSTSTTTAGSTSWLSMERSKPSKDRGDEPFPYDERKLLFRNLGNGRFEDVTGQAGAVFKLLGGQSRRGVRRHRQRRRRGRRGRQSSTVRSGCSSTTSATGNHWLGLQARGARAPSARPEGRDMLGARVEIVRKDKPTLWRRARADGSYASANDPRVLVGLGESTEAPTIRVRWPGGGVEEWPRGADRSMDDAEQEPRRARSLGAQHSDPRKETRRATMTRRCSALARFACVPCWPVLAARDDEATSPSVERARRR